MNKNIINFFLLFSIFIFGIDHILIFSNKKKCFFGNGNSTKKPTKKGLKVTPTLKYFSVLETFSGVQLFYIISIVETTLLITRPDTLKFAK